MEIPFEGKQDVESRYNWDTNKINFLFRQPQNSAYCRLMCILWAAFHKNGKYYTLENIETHFPKIKVGRSGSQLGYFESLREIVHKIGFQDEIKTENISLDTIVSENKSKLKKIAIFGIDGHALAFNYLEGKNVNYFDPATGQCGLEPPDSLDRRRVKDLKTGQMFETIFLW